MMSPVYPYLEETKRTSELPKGLQRLLTESELDALDWARKFMENYERKLQRIPKRMV